jgi:hypothetical protein
MKSSLLPGRFVVLIIFGRFVVLIIFGRFVVLIIFVAKQEQAVDEPIQLSESMSFGFLSKGQGLADPLLWLLQTTVQNTSRQTLRPQIG